MLRLLLDSYGSVSDIEVIFTVLAFIGLCFSLYNARESWSDYRALKRAGRSARGKTYDGRYVVAWNSLRAEIARSLIQFIYVVLGFYAFFLPEVSNANMPLKFVIYGIIARYGFIAATALLTLKSYWGYEVRRAVRLHYSGDPIDEEPSPEDHEPLPPQL